jgi:threonine/homoserine/homoserine lactone efflux protein
MDHARLLVFAAAYFAALVLPGPGVTALIARVLARGTHGAPAFIAGFVVGSLLWFTIAATGLAVLATSFATIFIAIRYAGAAYLLYLALKLWTAPARPADAPQAPPDDRGRLFLTGVAINLGNPKVIVFFLSIMPLAVDLAQLTLPRFALLALLSVVILAATLFSYALAANQARAWMRSSRAMNIARKTAAGVMAGVALTIVTR